MMNFIWVFIGGGLGSIARYSIGKIVFPAHWNFPMATFISNFIACFLLGILMAVVMKNSISDTGKLLLMTGFCGGFSTFSTFTGETFGLLQNGDFSTALINIFGSILLCMLALIAGFKSLV